MSRREAQKKIHYVRAVYSQNYDPGATLEELVRQALRLKPTSTDTHVPMRQLGVVGVRVRHREWDTEGAVIKLSLGGGTPNESIGTLGLNTEGVDDDDTPHEPLENRAFKLAEAFVLIDGNDVLVITDGAIRGYGVVYRYLKGLFDSANLPPNAQAFDFHPASNQDKRQTLVTEGVESLAIKGTMYAATEALAERRDGGVHQSIRDMKRGLQAIFSGGAQNEEQLEALARSWGEVNVTTTIRPKHKSIQSPILLRTIDEAAQELVDEIPDDAEVTITTRSGNKIKSGDVILTKVVRLYRKEYRNDIDHLDAWEELDRFRDELMQRGAWQR
ncbi:hypothetical protein HaloA020_35110 [Halomonas sp. A020]|uniref:hypothetical protein n=1 Tax=Halomonas sp. A020 TaxID=2717374 RepID=UPI0024906CD0|nr:hypothetical protein [Halomonas sp. A020]BCB62810.1 hypothetical protein HaloA020_35110 [Halomonas sp. A020]